MTRPKPDRRPVFTAKTAQPEPPDDLGDAASDVWRATLAALPAGFVATESLPLLRRYCEHVARAAELERLIAATAAGTDAWCRLVAVAGTESRTITALARGLRLTTQSRLRATTAATAATRYAEQASATADDDISDHMTIPVPGCRCQWCASTNGY